MTTKQILIHSSLFIVTFFTTTVAGVAWQNLDPFDLYNLSAGLPYSISILFILSCHEFGHYFAARYHGINATLPYYIPAPSLPGFLNFGTFGAVIRTKSPIPSKKVMFDIGVAGPIAGFIATVGILIYGFTHLPGKEYILQIHPDYFSQTQQGVGVGLAFGSSALYKFLEIVLTNPMHDFVPPMSEMYHYPFLCTGWFGLFVTAMNLIPVGQLDGGHLSYAMFGGRHKIVANVSFGFLLLMGIIGFLPAIGISSTYGWTGWIFWALILFFFVKLYHPPVMEETELDANRNMVGWLTFGILVISFAPSPFNVSL
ncbi:MAG: site-2 protease family protein [Bacteroidota bacterium]|nr:site-2 protease family protein [Bacteroidota bacterium]